MNSQTPQKPAYSAAISPKSPKRPNTLSRKSIALSRKSIKLTYNPNGILCALAHCKLCFEYLKTISGTQNQLAPQVGRDALRSHASIKIISK